MPLPTPFTAPPIPQTDVLTLLLDKPATGFEEARIVFQDSNSTSNPLTFSDLRLAVRQFGHSLHERVGVQPGDCVGILSVHGVHYPVILFGILCAGAQAVPMNPQLPVREVLHFINMTGLKTIVVDADVLDKVADVVKQYPELRVIVSDHDKSQQTQFELKHWTFDALLSGPGMDWPRGPEVNESVALINFSSGTSGLPKAVLITHQKIVTLQHVYHYAALHHSLVQDGVLHHKYLCTTPAFHASGLWASMIDCLYHGHTSIVMQRFTLPRFLQMVEEHKPTDLMLSPPLVLVLATDPIIDKCDFSSITRIVCGAAPLSNELADACIKRLNPKIRLQQVWGMTELVCMGTCSNMADRYEELHKPGSVGYHMPFHSLRIVDIDTGDEIQPSAVVDVKDPAQRGELQIKGPAIFERYLGMSDEQMSQFFTDDGFFRTGDIAVADQDGCVWIVDRLKELIKSSSFQVAPAEVEGLLLTHPDIDDCAVIGVPARQGTTEDVCACIVLKPGSALDQKDAEEAKHAINAWYHPQVMDYKSLSGGIRFVKSVPKSPAGKILRRQLRDQLQVSAGQA